MPVSNAKTVTSGKPFPSNGIFNGFSSGRSGISNVKNAYQSNFRGKSNDHNHVLNLSLKTKIDQEQEMYKDYLSGNRSGLEEYVSRVGRSGKPLEKIREYLTIKEAAKHIGKSDKTIRNYIKQGRLPALMDEGKYGDRYVIPLEALEALENEDYQPSIPKPAVENEPVSTPVSNPSTAVVPTYDLPVVMGMMEHRVKAMVNEAIEERWKGLEKRLEERDRKLMEVIRDKQEEAKKNRPLLARLMWWR